MFVTNRALDGAIDGLSAAIRNSFDDVASVHDVLDSKVKAQNHVLLSHNRILYNMLTYNARLEETVAELYAIVDDLTERLDGKAKPVKKATKKPASAAESDIRGVYPKPAKKATAPRVSEIKTASKPTTKKVV